MLQSGRVFPRILQAFWEADLVQGPVRVSNMDITDAYHRVTVKPSKVGEFVYITPSAPGYEGCIICIDLVILMGWVNSPIFFCAFSETDRCGKRPGGYGPPGPVLRRDLRDCSKRSGPPSHPREPHQYRLING